MDEPRRDGDHIAGTLGDGNKDVAIGKEIRQGPTIHEAPSPPLPPGEYREESTSFLWGLFTRTVKIKTIHGVGIGATILLIGLFIGLYLSADLFNPTGTVSPRKTPTPVSTGRAVLLPTLTPVATWTPTPDLTATPNAVPMSKQLITKQLNEEQCEAIVEAIEPAISACSEVGINQACLGNTEVVAQPPEVRFNAPGDRQPIQSLSGFELIDSGTVLMLLQTDTQGAPRTLVVTYPPESLEMNAPVGFFLTLVEGAPICQQIPTGMMIVTDSGARGTIEINGFLIDLS